jgi:hypothetical protein
MAYDPQTIQEAALAAAHCTLLLQHCYSRASVPYVLT